MQRAVANLDKKLTIYKVFLSGAIDYMLIAFWAWVD